MTAVHTKIETELRFIVRGDGWPRSERPSHMLQAYLSSVPERTVRVRLDEHGATTRARLTIKGKDQGGSRAEFEYPIPAEDARRLVDDLCEPAPVEKHRHWVPWTCPGVTRELAWEIDEFRGDNAGLVIAELELEGPEEFGPVRANLPEWCGIEVTTDYRFANSNLASCPFASWAETERRRLTSGT